MLVGRAVDGDREVPFAALRSALGPISGAIPEGSRLRNALAHGGKRSRDDGEATESAFAELAEELGELLDAASFTAPLALVLDDAQWMDDDLQRLHRPTRVASERPLGGDRRREGRRTVRRPYRCFR